MAIMADFARMPNQRKVMVFVVIGVLSFLLYYQFVLTKLRAEVEDAENQHEAQVTLTHKLDRDIKDSEDLRIIRVILEKAE